MNWSKQMLRIKKSVPLIMLMLVWGSLFIPKLSSQHVHIMSAEETGHYSTRDSIDHFFDRVQPLEVSIQLKDSAIIHLDQAKASRKLREAMRKQGINPDSAQNQILRSAMKEALRLSSPYLNDYPLNDTTRIGIIQGDLYGPSVFYTREYGIYVPAPMIQNQGKDLLTRVLIHEIFHIQSRMYPDLQERLYAHLGFQKLEHPVKYPKTFLARTILNPDGTDWDYYIPLTLNDKDVLAFPLIVSANPHFNPENSDFFSYVKFQLFPIEMKKGMYHINYGENYDGLEKKWMQPFFETITDNTNYIIHPDELMADNFVFLTQWLDDGVPPEKMSQPGKELLRKLAGEYSIQLP